MSGSAQGGDTLLFDMSQTTEGSPSVFVRRDWLSILDNMNQSYIGNQSIIDTSQLANSNKYMSYYEATLILPMILTLTQQTGTNWVVAGAQGTGSGDYIMGLKNWLGTVVHSFTLDYNGTTIIQQTPFINLWNSFCLMTSFNYNDFTEWASIGFYPDTSTSFAFNQIAGGVGTFNGIGVSNNQNYLQPTTPSTNLGQQTIGNIGFLKRQQYWAFDPNCNNAGGNVIWGSVAGGTQGLLSLNGLQQSYKSYIFNKINGNTNAPATIGVIQQAIVGQIKLRHLHNFFQEVPLLKGVFMKLTLNLNNTSFSFGYAATGFTTLTNLICPLGGTNPLMISSGVANNGSAGLAVTSYNASIAVGGKVINPAQASVTGVQSSPLLQSIMLNVPSYVFNPIYEQAYLSSSVKTIVYNDLYQYQVINVQPLANFNNLITNGISGIQTILVLPFFNAGSSTTPSGNNGITPYQSPFTTEGGGTTSPLCLLGNFNVVISGQNSIYNTERYSYEQFVQQLYGLNAVNGGLTDGVNSGLINQLDFETLYNYYAVNVSRQLPIEEAVPKSVNIVGQNLSNLPIDLYVFVNYKTSISIDLLTGSRV
jgi:hypothetical protein